MRYIRGKILRVFVLGLLFRSLRLLSLTPSHHFHHHRAAVRHATLPCAISPYHLSHFLAFFERERKTAFLKHLFRFCLLLIVHFVSPPYRFLRLLKSFCLYRRKSDRKGYTFNAMFFLLEVFLFKQNIPSAIGKSLTTPTRCKGQLP
jgi:hypothetical protein